MSIGVKHFNNVLAKLMESLRIKGFNSRADIDLLVRLSFQNIPFKAVTVDLSCPTRMFIVVVAIASCGVLHDQCKTIQDIGCYSCIRG